MAHCTLIRPEQVIDLRWHVLRLGRPRESAVFPGDAQATHHGLWQDERLMVVLSLFSTPMEHGGAIYHQQLRGMATDPACQGQGLGSQLLLHVQQMGPIWCNARLKARSFYARAGWLPIGSEFDILEVGPHQRMVWAPTL
ncbi:MAG: GNAT superfamily N-acetyltransferase [Cognaticolwellia sp.]|jgi:GNAT superfamily N-acetyltransferase